MTLGSDPTPATYLRKIQTSSVYIVVTKTPLEQAPLLSKLTGASVWLKREDLLPVRSFKLRGAYNRMAQLSTEEFERGVVAASAGNHAQGVAYAAKLLGTKATIVVPVVTPEIKTQAIRELGAELLLEGNNYDEAYAFAIELSRTTGRAFIHPYDDPDVIAGQGTVGLEIADQLPAGPAVVFVPVGGGGLICGVALALKQLRPDVKVIGVEASDSDAMFLSLEAGSRVTLPKIGLFADGCAVRQVGERTFELAKQWVDEVVVASNDEICGAVKEIFEDRRAIVEPSGALAYAGLKKWLACGAPRLPGPGAEDPAPDSGHSSPNLVAILSGANLNFDRLQFIAERAQVGSRTEAIFAIRIPEKPGTFLELCRAIGRHNLTEFNYRMGNRHEAMVFAGVAIRDQGDAAGVQRALENAGFQVTDLTDIEVAKLHIRHMVGGRSPAALDERVFRVEFPEQPGALEAFLAKLDGRWNISLFHYRNHGSDRGRALVGFQVPEADEQLFQQFVGSVGDRMEEETDSEAVKLFLG